MRILRVITGLVFFGYGACWWATQWQVAPGWFAGDLAGLTGGAITIPIGILLTAGITGFLIWPLARRRRG